MVFTFLHCFLRKILYTIVFWGSVTSGSGDSLRKEGATVVVYTLFFPGVWADYGCYEAFSRELLAQSNLQSLGSPNNVRHYQINGCVVLALLQPPKPQRIKMRLGKKKRKCCTSTPTLTPTFTPTLTPTFCVGPEPHFCRILILRGFGGYSSAKTTQINGHVCISNKQTYVSDEEIGKSGFPTSGL